MVEIFLILKNQKRKEEIKPIKINRIYILSNFFDDIQMKPLFRFATK